MDFNHSGTIAGKQNSRYSPDTLTSGLVPTLIYPIMNGSITETTGLGPPSVEASQQLGNK